MLLLSLAPAAAPHYHAPHALVTSDDQSHDVELQNKFLHEQVAHMQAMMTQQQEFIEGFMAKFPQQQQLELTPTLADVDAEREEERDAPRINALVDVRICSAIPLLEQKIGHCLHEDLVVSDYHACVMMEMDKVKGHEGVLLRNLYGLMMIADKPGGIEAMTHREIYNAFRLMEWDAKHDDDIASFLNMNGKGSSQTGALVMAGAQCILTLVPYGSKAAAFFKKDDDTALERDDGDAGGSKQVAAVGARGGAFELPDTLAEFERERRSVRAPAAESGCAFLLTKVAQAFMQSMEWNNVDSWRVKADTELIDTYLEELQLILARMEMLRVTSLALKELLCTVALYKTYWDYRWADVKKIYDDKGETASTGEKAKPAPGFPIQPFSDTRKFLPSLGLTRVVQSSKMSSAKEYFLWDSPSSSTRGPDMALMVDDMLEQLDRVKTNMRQALQAQIVEATMPKEMTPEQEANYKTQLAAYRENIALKVALKETRAVETSQTLTMNQKLRLEAAFRRLKSSDDKLKCSFDPFDFTLVHMLESLRDTGLGEVTEEEMIEKAKADVVVRHGSECYFTKVGLGGLPSSRSSLVDGSVGSLSHAVSLSNYYDGVDLKVEATGKLDQCEKLGYPGEKGSELEKILLPKHGFDKYQELLDTWWLEVIKLACGKPGASDSDLYHAVGQGERDKEVTCLWAATSTMHHIEHKNVKGKTPSRGAEDEKEALKSSKLASLDLLAQGKVYKPGALKRLSASRNDQYKHRWAANKGYVKTPHLDKVNIRKGWELTYKQICEPLQQWAALLGNPDVDVDEEERRDEEAVPDLAPVPEV